MRTVISGNLMTRIGQLEKQMMPQNNDSGDDVISGWLNDIVGDLIPPMETPEQKAQRKAASEANIQQLLAEGYSPDSTEIWIAKI